MTAGFVELLEVLTMRSRATSLFCLLCLTLCACPLRAQEQKRLITGKIDESKLVTLGGNTTPAAARAEFDRGAVPDDTRFEHLLLLLKRDPDTEARVKQQIDAMHDPASPQFHRWLTAEQFGARFGVHPQDSELIQEWLKSHGFTVNQAYKNGLLLDIAGSAKQIREAFHTEMHNLVLPNGDKHIVNIRDPQVPAALAPAIEGMPLHDFFRRPRVTKMKPVSFDHDAGKAWQPHFTLPFEGVDLFVVAPFDFATIYNLTPLWNQGFTGKGITIATARSTPTSLIPAIGPHSARPLGLDGFKQGSFKQIYPGCKNPGQNGDEIEAALDVEWASAAAPDANVELFACPDTQTTSGLDTAIINLLETDPPDIISDSYGLCETVSGQAEVALENFEAEFATMEGVTFFIAQGRLGRGLECAPIESTNYSTLGINSGDNTATAFAVDVGGTDFMAQYNQDTSGVPISNYWSDTNNPVTLASARSYIPEIPWERRLHQPAHLQRPARIGGFTQSFGPSGFCNSSVGQQFFLEDIAGSGGGPSTCFTGTPSIPGVVSGTCRGNPKPSFQFGVPGMPPRTVGVTSPISLCLPGMACGTVSMLNVSPTRIREARPALPATTPFF